MKRDLSTYLEKQVSTLKQLITDLSKEFKYVSVLGMDSIGTNYSVSRSGSGVRDSFWNQRGFVIRVFNGANYSEYSFNSLSDVEAIKQKVRKIAVEDIKIFKENKIELMEFPLIDDLEIKENFTTDYKIDPFEISAEVKLDKMTKMMQYALSKDKRLLDARVVYEEVKISKLFISTKKELSQSILFTNMGVIAIARKDNKVKYEFDGHSGLIGYEIFENVEVGIDQLIKNVIELLDSEMIKPGEYDIICNPAVSGLIAHEAFGHGVEMDMFVKNRAKGMDYMNKYVANNLVNMRDGARSAEEVGTYLFDDEGTFGTDTLVIDNGILKSGISDLLSALKLGTAPTGNGRRESFERKAYARMTNTFFEAGEDSLEDMIKSIKKGYLLENYFSGMEDPKNWGIQCVIAKGREIIDGKITGKIFSPITLTGYVPDLLKSISMVSKEGMELSGMGVCGKGHKEFCKTSTGGTYVKAVGRLS